MSFGGLEITNLQKQLQFDTCPTVSQVNLKFHAGSRVKAGKLLDACLTRSHSIHRAHTHNQPCISEKGAWLPSNRSGSLLVIEIQCPVVIDSNFKTKVVSNDIFQL